jgi:hypothetical protein
MSNGEVIEQLQPLKKFLPKLAKLQRRMAGKKKFSNNLQVLEGHQQKPRRRVCRRLASQEHECIEQRQESKAGEARHPEVRAESLHPRRQSVRIASAVGVQDAMERRPARVRATTEHQP